MKIIDLLNKSKVASSVDYSSSFSQLSAYPLIYGKHSNKIEDLTPSFIPYANHIISFIDQWTMSNPEYGYEIVTTRRSWYSQKKVTTIYEDFKNGLSWYLYGNAISINVYQKKYDELFSTNGGEDVVHNSINFEDGSAKKFILDANEWFSNNPLDIEGNNRFIKIFGIYPSIKESMSIPMSELFKKYRDDVDVIYWGGLFSSYSNFTHWEWHPGLLPNEIWKKREDFLNNALLEVDFDKLISSEVQTEVYRRKYPSNHSVILEEDLISLIKLKSKINLTREYSILEIFDWANTNPHSLRQMSMYYKIMGSYNNESLFNILRKYSGGLSLKYDTNGLIVLSGSDLLSITYDDNGNYYLEFYNEFSEKISYDMNTSFTLPVDHKLGSDEFDLVELSIDDEISEVYSSTLSEVSISQVNHELSGLIANSPDPRFEVNEHGLIGELTISPEKTLSLSDLERNINNYYVFEEMITPPNQVNHNKIKGSKIIDISNIKIKKDSIPSVDAMVNPDKMFR